MIIGRSQPFLVSLGTLFLACTESISILENLQECGVKEAQQLLAIINKRKESIK
jgi:phage-related holin